MTLISRRTGRVEVGSDTIEYEVATPSDGPSATPAVLVHGSGGNRATWWSVVPLLARSRPVITLDVRGAGRSTDNVGLLGPYQVAADLEAIRIELGLERWHLVGHSLGGWPALRYACEYPQRTASASAVSSIAGSVTPAVERWMADFVAASATWAASDMLGRSASLGAAFCEQEPASVYLYQYSAT